MKKGVPGPEGSLGKWMWADVNQRLTEFALDLDTYLARRLTRSTVRTAQRMLTRHRTILERTFRLPTAYMPKEASGMEIVDPHQHGTSLG